MGKAPKRYECLECGFISDKHKTIKFPTMSFACCFKCKGRVKEREDWLEWLHAERVKYYESINA